MENKTIGIIALISSLALFGGTLYLTEDQLKTAYYCELTKEVGVFPGGLSSTEVRGYPTENTTKGYKDCKSKWVKLETYAKSKGVDPLSLIVKETIINNEANTIAGKSYICDNVNCIEVK